MKRTLMWSTAIAGFFCAAIAAEGQQRVLLSFDDAGHQVRKIVRIEAKNTLQVRPSEPDTQVLDTLAEESYLDTLISQLKPGNATLVWLDESGRWYANTSEPDPRVAHAPSHINGRSQGRVGDVVSAWLVTGPESARFLTILLPEDASLALAFEQWNINLSVE